MDEHGLILITNMRIGRVQWLLFIRHNASSASRLKTTAPTATAPKPRPYSLGLANAPSARPSESPETFSARTVARADGRISVINGMELTMVNSNEM